jgi:hypothetical protein
VHGGLLAHQLLHGIDGVEGTRPEIFVVPSVLADGDGQPDAVQFDYLLRPRRGKVALLIEDVVERQQALVLFKEQTASIEQNGGVYGRLATFDRQGHACEHGCRQIPSGGGQLIDSGAAASEKAGLFEKVGRRITANDQFGKDGETRALGCGATAGRNDFLKISGEIPDSWVDLG